MSTITLLTGHDYVEDYWGNVFWDPTPPGETYNPHDNPAFNRWLDSQQPEDPTPGPDLPLEPSQPIVPQEPKPPILFPSAVPEIQDFLGGINSIPNTAIGLVLGVMSGGTVEHLKTGPGVRS